MYIFFIILGLALRLINIDKPEGLWNDEYVSWFIASTPFKLGFFSEMLKQCHMPLYYFYLKPFSMFNDIVLRLSSVIPGILSIITMYLLGKEYSKKIAYFATAITTVLSFLIYYSQEVRFYSLLFLMSSISLLYTIRLVKNTTKKNYIGYILSNILILTTHVLGIIYVFFSFIYVAYKKKFISLNIVLGISIIIISVLPMGLNIIKMLPSSQWWGSFSYTNILFLFSDFFSPILTNNINAPKVFYYSSSITFITLITIPTIIAIIGILLGAIKNKGILCMSIGTIFIMSLLAYCGKIVFITKYSIEILPILILLMSIGFSTVKNIKLGYIMFFAFILFHIYAIFTPYYTANIERKEGNKIVGDILNEHKPEYVLYTYYDENRFMRYIQNNNNFKSLHISKTNRSQFIEKPSKILDEVGINKKISVVLLDSVSFIPAHSINIAKENNVPEMFITFSEIRNKLIEELNNNYKNYNISRKGNWTIITATKYK